MPAVLNAPKVKVHGLAAVLAVSLIFALSRWGSYIHAGPIFITDVLLAIATVHMFLGRVKIGPTAGGSIGRAALLGVALAYAAARLVLGGTYNLVAVRDAIPYIYAFVGLLAAWAYNRESAAGRAKTAKLLRIALITHLVWAVPAVAVGPILGPALSGNTYVFQIRADIDAALAAILAGLALMDLIVKSDRKLWNFLLLGASLYVVTGVPNRSALLSLAGALGVAFLAANARKNRGLLPLALLAAVPVMAVAVIAWLPNTTSGSRLLATFGGASTSIQAGAQGTTRARLNAWEQLIEYWTADMSRLFFGVGFGPDFLQITGTDVLLGSETFDGVRSPHNYLLGTAMRLGLVGVVITVAFLLAAFAAIVKLRDRIAEDKLLLTCALTVATLTPAAMVGVIFEAPFGAVPMFWASGILLCAATGRPGTIVAPRTLGLSTPTDTHYRPTRKPLSSTSRQPGLTSRQSETVGPKS